MHIPRPSPTSAHVPGSPSAGLRAAALGFCVCLAASLALAQDAGDTGPKPDDPAAGATAPDDPKAPDAAPKPPRLPNPGITEASGASREQMWQAPTEADWEKPCLITWQRSWDDAQAVARETGKAILVCVNMDGEIASEHYAGVRYRQPEVAALYEPYVTIIASVYRHTPRDYDDQGHRIECPRFGGVTCGEHISLEPLMFEMFLKPDRVAPRHVMVELDGKETYDIYYANDTSSVFDAIQDGSRDRKAEIKNIVRGDRPVTERVASREVSDREAAEAAYRNGDAATRKALLEQALAHPEASPVELLRLAVFGLDVDLAKLARTALAQSDSSASTDLVVEALGVPMDAAERESLIGALERIGKNSRKARWLAVVHRGLSGGSSPVDPTAWKKVERGAPAAAVASYDRIALHQRSEDRAYAVKQNPQDPAVHVELATAYLALARKSGQAQPEDAKTAKKFQQLMYHDVRRSALRAEELGSKDWRVSASIALASYYLGETEMAYERAEQAVKAMPAGETGWNSMAVLTIYGESRWKAIKKAVREKQDWPPSWLADLHSAYSVLLRHPLATDEQVVWHYDFLIWLRAYRQARGVLDEGINRFPASGKLHERLRKRLLRMRGPDGVLAAYDEMAAREDAGATLKWQAGFASMEAAEFHRRGRRLDRAVVAYAKAISHFESAIAENEAMRAGADHYIAFCLAGRARLAYQRGDDDAAYADVMASFARHSASAGSRDGMGVTPVETAQVLLDRLKEKDREELAISLRAGLDALPPEFLLPDRP